MTFSAKLPAIAILPRLRDNPQVEHAPYNPIKGNSNVINPNVDAID